MFTNVMELYVASIYPDSLTLEMDSEDSFDTCASIYQTFKNTAIFVLIVLWRQSTLWITEMELKTNITHFIQNI